MFTTGRGAGAGVPCTALVGNPHIFALGYVTIDLVSACAAKNALASDYFASLLYDNVLTGDYQQLETAQALLEEARVASVPGTAFFESDTGKRMLRFCYAKDFDALEEACKRIRAFRAPQTKRAAASAALMA